MIAQALRAPSRDGERLAVPSLEQVGECLAENRCTLLAPLGELRALARRELVALARQYLAARGEPVPDWSEGRPLFLAGHQPELFHPGVWAKNFTLAGLARQHGGAAINLLIDNDTVKSTSVRVPVHGPTGPTLQALPFDRWRGEVPWEERYVLDPPLFARFGDAATAAMGAWGITPLAGPLWLRVRVLLGAGPLGDALAAARRELERSWGCHVAELPISRLCAGEAFARFVARLLAAGPRLAEAYNAAVADYRRRHRLRSKSHPVPDLVTEGDWYEAPLWAWRAGAARRGRVFVLPTARGLRLRVSGEEWPSLPPPADEAAFAAAWRDLATRGHKLRSRALTTTLFARLLLADLFVHGIGGAKYDELADELMRRLFGATPPRFLVVSATRWLPVAAPDVTPEAVSRLERLLRDLHYNPQRHLTPEQAADWKDALLQRQELVAWSPEPARRRERFERLRAAADGLRPAVVASIEAARQQVEDARSALAARAVLCRRDYAFCLFPEATLRPFLGQLL